MSQTAKKPYHVCLSPNSMHILFPSDVDTITLRQGDPCHVHTRLSRIRIPIPLHRRSTQWHPDLRDAPLRRRRVSQHGLPQSDLRDGSDTFHIDQLRLHTLRLRTAKLKITRNSLLRRRTPRPRNPGASTSPIRAHSPHRAGLGHDRGRLHKHLSIPRTGRHWLRREASRGRRGEVRSSPASHRKLLYRTKHRDL